MDLTRFDPHDLPDFRSWSARFSPPADAHAYLSEHLSITAASLFADLLFPELVIVRDCVLIASHYEPVNFDEWWTRTGGDKRAVERAINHLHLWDLLDPSDEVEERAVQELASCCATAWLWHAEHKFPERSFEVVVTDEYGPTIVMSSQSSQAS